MKELVSIQEFVRRKQNLTQTGEGFAGCLLGRLIRIEESLRLLPQVTVAGFHFLVVRLSGKCEFIRELDPRSWFRCRHAVRQSTRRAYHEIVVKQRKRLQRGG